MKTKATKAAVLVLGLALGAGAGAASAGSGKGAGGDEGAARAAYLAAIAKKYGSSVDEAAAMKALGEVAKSWPATAYGKRAKDELDAGVSTYPLPAPLGAFFLPWFLLSRSMAGYDDYDPGTVGPGVGPSPGSTGPASEEAKAAAKKARAYLEIVKKESLRYFKEEHVLKDGSPMPHEFPSTTAVMPPTIPCGKYATPATEKAFKDLPTWAALKFVPDVKLPFTFEYRADGQDEFAHFEFVIHGDVDCDGYYSEFRIGAATDGTMEPVVTGPTVTAEFE